MSKIVITGGSGFIGTNVVQLYIDKGDIVKSIDKFKPKNKKHLEVFSNIDIEDEKSLEINSYSVSTFPRCSHDCCSGAESYAVRPVCPSCPANR